MLASVYSYCVMVKSVSSCCVRGRRVLSNPVTNEQHSVTHIGILHIAGHDILTMLLIGCEISSMMAKINFSSHIFPQQLINHCMAQNFDRGNIDKFSTIRQYFPLSNFYI